LFLEGRTMGKKSDKAQLFHKIRNCINPIQTFLHLVDTHKEDPKLQKFQELCKENLEELKTLLENLENES